MNIKRKTILRHIIIMLVITFILSISMYLTIIMEKNKKPIGKLNRQGFLTLNKEASELTGLQEGDFVKAWGMLETAQAVLITAYKEEGSSTVYNIGENQDVIIVNVGTHIFKNLNNKFFNNGENLLYFNVELQPDPISNNKIIMLNLIIN